MAFRPGDYYVICDQCGFRKFASECRMTWNNMFVCADTCWEPRHEQDKEPTGLHERQTVPIHRPEGDSIFLSEFYSDGTLSYDGSSYYKDEHGEEYEDSD